MTSNRVNEIDLLRFIASMMVVFFHYSFRGYAGDAMSIMPYPWLAPWSKYGYLGVELFFMISGFVILMTAASGGVRSFAISRIVRLYPAFWACCTLTFVATLAIGAPRFTTSVGHYLVNMTMLSEFVGVATMDGAYWSLFVELKFYAMVAFVLLLGGVHQAELFLVLWLIASIALEWAPVSELRYLLNVDYSAFFIAGATCFLIWSRGVSPARIGIMAVSWGLAIFESIRQLRGFEAHYHTSMNPYAVTGIVTTFFIVMLLVSLRRTGAFAEKRWLATGALTYPLYLLHEHIGFMIFNRFYPAVNAHLLLWGMIAASLAAAYAVHVLVEKRLFAPMKNSLNNLAQRIACLRLSRA